MLQRVFFLALVIAHAVATEPLAGQSEWWAEDRGDDTHLVFIGDTPDLELHRLAGLMKACQQCTLEGSNGVVHKYQGPIIKFAEIGFDDAEVIEGGGTIRAFRGNLAEWFGVDVSGEYVLHLVGVLLTWHAGLDEWTPWSFHDDVSVVITERHVLHASMMMRKRHSQIDVPLMGVQYTTSSCSASEQSTLAVVTDLAEGRVSDAVDYLTASCVGCKYVHMFGSYSTGRYATVKTGFTAMQSKLSASSFIYDCSALSPCGDSILAFVYAGDATHRIHLCDDYWLLSTAWGYDSKPGTVVHELSHFTTIHGNEDHVYGLASALALASSSPSLAVDNADNWEYFVEQGISPVGCTTSISCSDAPPSTSLALRAARVDWGCIGVVVIVLYAFI